MAPEANVFLVINLGCEMLYVIDQRLKAQKISQEKSMEVVRDITSVLLDPKLIERIIIGSKQQKSLITSQHCKFMLGDIACCSLMRLDEASMQKLWNLMTMVFKWQIFVTKHPQHLLDVTFRHLDGLGKMHPEVKKSILVDCTKNTILDFWNGSTEALQLGIYKTIKSWLECFNVKISLLLRLGFQSLDSSFYKDCKETYYEEFAGEAGTNIYMKSIEITAALRGQGEKTNKNRIDNLQIELNVPCSSAEAANTNIFFEDEPQQEEMAPSKTLSTTFVQLQPLQNQQTNPWENFIAQRMNQRKKVPTYGGETNVLTTSQNK